MIAGGRRSDERSRGLRRTWVLRHLRWLTLDRVVIILLPFMFYTSFTGALHIAATDVVFPVFAIVILRKPMAERQLLAVRPLCLFGLAMLTVIVGSALVASLSDPQFMVALAAKNTFKVVVVFLYAMVFAIHAAGLNRDELCGLLRTWAWIATVVSIATIVTAVGIVHIVPTIFSETRSVGFFQDPNLYGAYLSLTLAVVVAAEVMKHSNWTIVQLVTIMAAILLTASRGALVSLVLVLIMVFVFIASWKMRLILAGFGLAAATVLFCFGLAGGGSRLGPSIDRLVRSGRVVGDDPRLQLWARAISLWNDHPLLGVGIGQFGRFSIDLTGFDDDNVGQIAHNTFLSFLVETGLPGLLLCITGVGFLTVRLYRDQRLEIKLRHAFGLGVLVICVEMLTLNLHNVRFVWVFVGLVWGFTVWKSRCGQLADKLKPTSTNP